MIAISFSHGWQNPVSELVHVKGPDSGYQQFCKVNALLCESDQSFPVTSLPPHACLSLGFKLDILISFLMLNESKTVSGGTRVLGG